jgi:predicted acylesterase/phospholipase RssA
MLKDKLLLIMGAIIAALIAYSGILRGQKQKLKSKHDKERADRMEELYDAKTKAVDAMQEGLDNEAKPAKRGYFDDQ